MITGVDRRHGFALPTVIIASIIMMVVLITSVASTSGIRSAVLSQKYERMAQLAGEAGAAYAQACAQRYEEAGLDSSLLWTNANPLKPNTDCSGNELFSCPTTGAADRCAVAIDGNARSSFSVNAPTLDSDGHVVSVPQNGYVETLRTSTGSVVRTYRQPQVQALVVPDLCGGAASNELGWAAVSENGLNYIPDSASSTITVQGSAYPGMYYFVKYFNIAQSGNYDLSVYADDYGAVYIDDKFITEATHPNVFSQTVQLDAGCHAMYIQDRNNGRNINGLKVEAALRQVGSNITVVKTDNTWRVARGDTRHFTHPDYYLQMVVGSGKWVGVAALDQATATQTTDAGWASFTNAPNAKWVGRTTGTVAANTYQYLVDKRIITVDTPTEVRVSYECDDWCDVWMDGNVVASSMDKTNTYASMRNVSLTLTPGRHKFGITLKNSSSGPSAALLAVTQLSGSVVLTQTDEYWEAADAYYTADTSFYSSSMLFLPVPAPSISTGGLTAQYKFNGNANDSVGSNNGTVTGAVPAIGQNGDANGSYYFDGVNDVIEVPTAAQPDLSQFSISVWAKGIPGSAATSGVGYIVHRSNDSFQGGSAYWVSASGGASNLTAFFAGSVSGYNASAYSTQPTGTDTWYNIVVTYDGSNYQMYINGIPDGSYAFGAITNSTSNATNKIGVGGTAWDASYRMFQGQIDDLRFYNRVLTNYEAIRLYQQGAE